MIAPVCQRWREGRARYLPRRDVIVPARYEVAAITSDREARTFVERHHYSRSYPAARLRMGLYRGGALVGVAVFSQPPSQAALAAAFPFQCEGVELGRFVLLDEVPANGESWFLSRAFELARSKFEAVVAHSDPCTVRDASGTLVFGGHIGTIYQATNAVFLGVTPRRTRRVFLDGSTLSARALSKLRRRERGFRYVVEQLRRHGAPEPAGDWSAWARAAVESTTRTLRHLGNYRYIWALERRLARRLPGGLPYPKIVVAGGAA